MACAVRYRRFWFSEFVCCFRNSVISDVRIVVVFSLAKRLVSLPISFCCLVFLRFLQILNLLQFCEIRARLVRSVTCFVPAHFYSENQFLFFCIMCSCVLVSPRACLVRCCCNQFLLRRLRFFCPFLFTTLLECTFLCFDSFFECRDNRNRKSTVLSLSFCHLRCVLIDS